MFKLSNQDARRLMVLHHFQPTTLHGAFERLGSVQYDPLNPVGRNHDLVLQARVPGYSVDDWQTLAYQEHFLYDAWDKQASLVLMRDFPLRRIYYDWHAPRWREAILNQYPQAVEKVLHELEDRGPLSTTDFDYQEHNRDWEGSWFGPRVTKNVLRALWHTGQVQTCRRTKGKHVYDLTERVVPGHLYHAKPIPVKQNIDWLILLRHQALGLMRPNAAQAVWSLGVSATERRLHLQGLVKRGLLLPVEVDGVAYHVMPRILEHLDRSVDSTNHMRFVAPLDQLMWDRQAIAHLFHFDYVWEVYKPEKLRRWGYYVLPVMLDDRFVARLDARLSHGIWNILTWHWEDGVEPTPDLLNELERAVNRFRSYLGAHTLKVSGKMDQKTRGAFKSGFKLSRD